VQEPRGELADAAESYSRALEAEQEAVQGDSTNVSWIGDLSESHNKLAVVYRKQGRYRDALREHTREMEIKRRVLRLNPTHAYWTRRLAWAQHYMGRIELILGDLAAAEDSFEDAFATVAPLIERDPSNLTLSRLDEVGDAVEDEALRFASGKPGGSVAESYESVSRAGGSKVTATGHRTRRLDSPWSGLGLNTATPLGLV
jgi:tetratricopeptide (TPR) repeat protein